MTEAEWLASTNPAAMMRLLNGEVSWRADTPKPDIARPSDRKFRLFACACCRQPEVWDRLKDNVTCGKCEGRGFFRYTRLLATDGKDETCPDCNGTGRVNRSRRAVEVAERHADRLATDEELGRQHQEVANSGRHDDWICYFATMRSADSGADRIVNWGRGGDVVTSCPVPPATQTALIRCIAGNPFRKFVWWPGAKSVEAVRKLTKKDSNLIHLDRSWLTHDDGAVVKLAKVIYQERQWGLMPILADALEEAGCLPTQKCQKCHGSKCLNPGPNGQPKCPTCSNSSNNADVHGWPGRLWCSVCGTAWHPWPCDVCDGVGELSDPVCGLILAHLRGPGPHARGCHVIDTVLGKS